MNDETVLEIRARYARGLTVNELRDIYNLPARTIRRIVNGETYKHLPVHSRADASRMSNTQVEEILADLKKPNYRGRDAAIRRKWNISYEMLRRYKRMLDE